MPTQREILEERKANVKAKQQERFSKAQQESGLNQADFVSKIQNLQKTDPNRFQQFTNLIAGETNLPNTTTTTPTQQNVSQNATQQQTPTQPAPMDTTTGKPQGVEGTTLPLDRPEVTAEKIRADQTAKQVSQRPAPMDTTTGRPQDQAPKVEAPKIGEPQMPEAPQVQPPVWVDTADKLYAAVESNNVLPWSKEYEALKATSPQIVAEYEAKRKQEQLLSDINLTGSVLTGQPVTRTTQRASDQILEFLTKNLQTDVAGRFQQEVLNDPKLQASYDELENVQRDLNEIDDSLDSLGDEIRASFTGEVPEARLQARIAKEAWPLIKRRGQVLDELAIKQAEVTRLSEEAREIFGLKLQDAERIQDFAFQMYGVQRADEIRYEDIAREEQRYQQEIARADMEYQRAIERQDDVYAREMLDQIAMLEDERRYNAQLGDIKQTYDLSLWLADLGIDTTGMNKQQMLQQYASVRADLIAQEEAAAWVVDWDKTEIEDWVIMYSNPKNPSEYMIFDPLGKYTGEEAQPEMNTIDFLTKWEGFREQAYDDATGKPLAPWEKPIGTATIWYWYTSINGRPVQWWDTMSREEADAQFNQKIAQYSSWRNKITEDIPQEVQTVLTSLEFNMWPWVWWWANWKKILDQVNAWDYAWAAQTLKTSWMGTKNAKTWEVMQWLVNRRNEEAQLLMSALQEVEEFNQASVPQFEEYLKTGKIGASATAEKSIIDEFGSTEEFKRQAEAYNNSPDWPRQREVQKINSLREQISKAIAPENEDQLTDSVGTMRVAVRPKSRREREEYLAEIQNFLDGKTLQQLIDVKADGATFGALSNEELRMLQNSASVLNQLAIRDEETNRIKGFRGSEEWFKRAVQDTIDRYDEIISNKLGQMGMEYERSEPVWEAIQQYKRSQGGSGIMWPITFDR